MEYYVTSIDQSDPEISISGLLMLSAGGLGLVTSSADVYWFELHHLLLQYPHQAPTMVTLSFILITNALFLLLIICHTVTYSNFFSWDLISSVLRANILHVSHIWTFVLSKISFALYFAWNVYTIYSFDILQFLGLFYGAWQISHMRSMPVREIFITISSQCIWNTVPLDLRKF